VLAYKMLFKVYKVRGKSK